MLKNHLLVACRNLLKYKGYSAINIVGLAIGMAVAILIGLWIFDELSYNHYHRNHARLADILSTQTFASETETERSTVVPLEQELRNKYADDFKGLSLTRKNNFILAVDEKKITNDGLWAQPDLPSMLTLKMLHGTYKAFADPSTLLLSASVSRSFFGNANPVGQSIKVNNDNVMKVGGVYEDIPLNSDFVAAKILLPWYNKANWWNTQTDAWSNHGCKLVVEMSEPADFQKTSLKIKTITQQHGYIGSNERLSLNPMDNWHLYNEFSPEGVPVGGRIKFVWLFGITGVFILLLACINFMNLSTARSCKRGKEVGIRKAIGSNKGQLISQFLSESLLTSFLAILLSLLIVVLSIPFFNSIAEKEIYFPLKSLTFWLSITGFALLTGMVAGSYPAFYLSAFQPIKVLKGQISQGRYAALPRKILVVGQFTVSVMLIIGTLVVYRQVQFAKMRPLGYSNAGLITIPMNTPELWNHYDAIRNGVLRSGGAIDMAQSNSTPTNIGANNNGMEWAGKVPGNDPLFGTIAVSHDYGHTMGWEIIDGRDFSRNFNDTGAFILNEAALKIVGFKDPVGKTMRWQGKDHVITGIVKNMVMESPFDPIVPSIFILDPYWAGQMTIKLNPGLPVREALARIESTLKQINPGSPFNYSFVNEEYGRKFSDEERIAKLVNIFAILAIFISCLGLYGLASFVAEQRTKEIGVRKVLGASIFSVWKLLSKDFVFLVVIACGVAVPLAAWVLMRWLENYRYKIGLEWEIFAISGIAALLVTLLTVSFRSINAARMNPVNSLRSE